MLTALFFTIRYCVEGWLLNRQLRQQYFTDNQLILSLNVTGLRASKSTPIHYFLHKNTQGQSLEDKTFQVFSPLLLKLSAIRSVSPALGLCFTVISIMLAFSVFSSSGDIKEMFQAASVGLGTTAIGACVIVISKLMTDLVVLPSYYDMLDKHQQQITALKAAINKQKDKDTRA
jgi:hypothetical protein